METTDLLKKVRKIEIKTRGLSRQIFAGEYHSAFKGRGMTFSEVREYQYGDDIRSIDWNVTARFNHPYVKVFEEERELTVMLLIDVSGLLLLAELILLLTATTSIIRECMGSVRSIDHAPHDGAVSTAKGLNRSRSARIMI